MQANSQARAGRKEPALFVITILSIAAVLAAFSMYQPIHSTSTLNGPTSGPTPIALPAGLGTFRNYSQLEAFMAANAKSAQQQARQGTWFGGIAIPANANMVGTTTAMTTVMATMTMSSTSALAPSSASSGTSFTGSNVQVQGVDESDWVKTDGAHLFVATGGDVTIINAYPASAAKTLSTIVIQNGDVLGIEISQDRLMVIDQGNASGGSMNFLLYNTTNLSSPALMTNMSVAGTYVGSRMTQGYFYAIVQQPSYKFGNSGNATGVLPTATEDGVTATLPASSVYFAPNQAQISFYTMIISIGMADGKASTLSVLTGPSSTIYVSTSNIYVVYTDYQDWYADGIPGDVYSGGAIPSGPVPNGDTSTILRAAYLNGTVAVQAAGQVPGTVLNQFSMDEYMGDFRVATSRFASVGSVTTRSDDVYVLNQNMSQVSALQNIAPGENIYAVRFEGDMGYVVTFEQVDPLFAISFQNPAKPVIVSALKVTGYSDYLQQLSTGYLLGVGKDTLQSSYGNYSWYLGLKLSLFHVLANGSSTQVADYLIGDRGTDSPVLTDHLALTYDPSTNVTVIPVLLAQLSGNVTYSSDSPPPFGNPVWQGAYVFKVTQSGFTLLGRVSQYTNFGNYGDSPNQTLQITRSVIIGNDLYTVSQGEVMVSDLSSFSTLATIQLPG
jgi:uncharacterized secreted protein with C-terminal beta-propeller domain